MRAEAALGPRAEPFHISLMIPYPDSRSGTLNFGTGRFDLGTTRGRVAAAAAWVAAASERFARAGFHRLRLDGFYWLQETAPSSDAALLPQVAQVVHGRGLRFLWIPYYDSENWTRWRALGFDEAWLQPNYFFNRQVPPTRLDSAVARAEAFAMGLEIEFDGRLYADPVFADRLEPYVAALAAHPELRARAVAIYEGGGALATLASSHRASDRLRYEQLVAALR